MKFDLTITMSIIIGLVATLPQIIVAFINNYYQYKSKKLDTYKIAKRNAIKDFIDDASNYCTSSASVNVITAYYKSLNNIKLYIDNLDLSLIEKLKESRKSDNINIYFKQLDEVITYLSQFVDKK